MLRLAVPAAAILRLPVLYGDTPSVLFGPSGAMIHSTDEFIEFEQVIDCARVLARMAVDWCGDGCHREIADMIKLVG